MDLNQYISALKESSAKQLDLEITLLKDLIGNDFQELLTILQKYQKSLRDQGKKSPNRLDYWSLFLNYIQKINGWIGKINQIPGTCIRTEFPENWHKDFKQTVDELPEKIRINLEKTAAQSAEEASFRFKLWKWYIRRSIGISIFNNDLSNWFRNIFKKEKRTRKPYHRDIPLPKFLEFNYGFPVLEYCIKEFQKFLQSIDRFIQEIHQLNESHKDSLLILENFSNQQNDLEAAEIQKFIAETKEIGNKIVELLEFIDNSDTRIRESFDINSGQIGENVTAKGKLLGTPLLSLNNYDSKKIKTKWEQILSNQSFIENRWNKHFQSEREDWQKDLELSILQINLGILSDKHLAIISNKLENQFSNEFLEVNKLLVEVEKKFSNLSFDNSENLKNRIGQENETLLKLLRQETLPELTDKIIAASIQPDITNILQQSLQALEGMSDQHNVFKFRDVENLPPRSKVENIPLKELVQEEYGQTFISQHKLLEENVREKLDTIFRNISEIDQIVEFNLEAAINLLNESEEDQSSEANQMVIDGLGRAKSHIENLIRNSKELSNFIRERQTENTLELENKIQKLVNNEKIIELKFQIAKAKTKEELRAKWRTILITFKRMLPIVLVFLKKQIQDIYQKYTKLRRLTRLVPASVRIEDEITRFLIETKKRIKSLPYIYQRLFRLEPLEDSRFFSARDSEMEILEEQFQLWVNGNFANTALVGERGSGKTTLINFSKQKFFKNEKLYQYDFTRRIYDESELLEELKTLFKFQDVSDFTELENRILQQEERSIVIFENIQNLFIRKVNGFKTLERFMLFTARTHSKIYWLISCTIYSWEYLDKVLQLSKFFQNVLWLKDFPQEEVENIILKRHRVSGYRLIFIEPPDILKSKKYKKLRTDEDKQAFLQKTFFTDLHDLSMGNITITLLFWLRAIQELTDDKISIQPLSTFDFSFLGQLPAEEIFTLTAFMQHENLNLKEFSEIFNQHDEKASLLLTRLFNSGILLKNERGYHIHPFLYRSVVQTLKSRNLL